MVENVIQIKSGIMINVDVSVKKHNIYEKDYIWNSAKCSCKNGKYLANIMDNSAITFDEIIDAVAGAKLFGSYYLTLVPNKSKVVIKIFLKNCGVKSKI